MAGPDPIGDVRTFTVRVPISIRRRGGRKLVLAPDGTPDTGPAIRRRIDNAMVKAVARAFRWREMLQNGTHATIAEIAAAEKINESSGAFLLVVEPSRRASFKPRDRSRVVELLPAEVCERMRRDGGSIFPAHANTGDPNGPLEACPLMRSQAR